MTREEISEINSDAVIWDGLDDAIIGMAERCGLGPVVAYSVEKIILILIQQGMSEEESWEWYDYNIAGAFIGENIPVHIFI